jgi:deoxyribodipyrimidine photo-lyase
MIAFRRSHYNFALQRAVELSCELNKPLLVLEGLRCGYRWASDRLHRFVLQGMAHHRARFAAAKVAYYPYVEPEQGAGKGLLEALARRACAVVTDDYPCFFLPDMISAAGSRLAVRCEAVDSNGLLPLRAADRVFARAFDFRRFLQRNIQTHLAAVPAPDPLDGLTAAKQIVIPDSIRQNWPAASPADLEAGRIALARLPIDHDVAPAPFDGGEAAGQRVLRQFLQTRLPHYDEGRNDPDEDASSGLSPYLHFGHISTHEIFAELARREGWSPDHLAGDARGARQGWWGLSPAAESFLDELVTWRELGYNMSWQRADYDQYDSLPEWAQQTLAAHVRDPRPHLYDLEQLEQAATHDRVWNASQRQLVRDGRLHNYLRMLWGKKILEWSATPRQAADVMIELNNKYAVDGRDPNSYSGIFWVLGRYDRPWGPERPIFGKVRYMSSASTLRKLKLDRYLQTYALPLEGAAQDKNITTEARSWHGGST